MGRHARIAGFGATAVILLVLGAPPAHALPVAGQIASQANPQQVLDAENASTTPGARVITYAPNGGDNQQWVLRDLSGGAVTIIGVAGNLCVTPTDRGVVLGRCTFSTNQAWQVEPRDRSITFHSIRFPGQCLTFAGTGQQIRTTDCDGSNAQEWDLIS